MSNGVYESTFVFRPTTDAMRDRVIKPSTWLLAGALLTLAAAVHLTGCGDSLSETGGPADPSATDSSDRNYGGKADIYGDDDRREYFETQNRLLRKVGRASAVLVDEQDLAPTGDGTVRLPDTTLGDDLPACPTVKFSEQPVPGNCSGFLVAPDILVSAGHCIKTREDCRSTRVAFGFRYEESTDENATTLPRRNVYACESILAHGWEENGKTDYGVYRLDRPVEGVEPLEFRTDGNVPADTRLAVVGHPMGLPLKITDGGRIVDNTPREWFLYNLDAFGGHSGAPVVDVETGLVEGLHVRGAPDFETSNHEGRFCYEMRRCEEVDPDSASCYGTEGTRSPVFGRHVPTATTGATGTEDCCRVCTNGQACGDGCISESATCRQPHGCACEAPDDG